MIAASELVYIIQRVYRITILPDLEVEMGTCADAGHSGVGDDGSCFNVISRTVSGETGEMLVQGGDPAAVVDPDVIAPGTAVGGIHDTTGGHGYDLGSHGTAYVDGLMVGGGSCGRGCTITKVRGDVMTGRTGPYPGAGGCHLVKALGGTTGRTASGGTAGGTGRASGGTAGGTGRASALRLVLLILCFTFLSFCFFCSLLFGCFFRRFLSCGFPLGFFLLPTIFCFQTLDLIITLGGDLAIGGVDQLVVFLQLGLLAILGDH